MNALCSRRKPVSFNPTFLLKKKGAVDGTKENFAGDRSPCAPRGRGFLPKGKPSGA